MKEESVWVIGVGKDDEMASARSGMGRVWIGGCEFGPAEGVGVKKPETVLCDGMVISVETAVYDEVWSVGRGAWTSGSGVGVSWRRDNEGVCGCVLQRERRVTGVRLCRWCICCFRGR